MKWTIHFKDSYLVEGALDWSKVSTTSVERPEAMSCAPSGATPTVSTTPHGGERTNPHLRGRRSRWVGISHAESYARTPLSRAIGGEGVQTKPLPCLYHGIQPQWNWISPREPEGILWGLSRCKQVHLGSTKLLPNLLHHLGVHLPLTVRTSTWCPLRSGTKCFKAWNTASISRQLMCHMRWGPSHRNWAERPLMTSGFYNWEKYIYF